MNGGAHNLTPGELHLPPLAPDRARTERVRARCHAALAARQAEAARCPRNAAFTAAALETVITGALCALYLVAVIHDVLRLRGVY